VVADALTVAGVSMTFPGTRALINVDVAVRAGEIHGLVGHNGSGKSTLIKIRSGVYRPEGGGSVQLWGENLPWGSPTESERLGLRVVHQNLGLISELSVTENIAMGSGYRARGVGRIAWAAEHRRAAGALEALGYAVNPKTPVGQLPAAARTAVGIARALLPKAGAERPRLLLLDEVTATMPEAEIDRLLDLVRRLRTEGTSVLYVSHHLEEVLEVCDSVTVLKDGKVVTSAPASDLTFESLADHVVGSSDWRLSAQGTAGNTPPHPDAGGQAVLKVNRIDGEIIRDLSFDASPGRIVGITGITGSGREELACLLIGASARSGTVTIEGTAVPAGDPCRSVRMGMTIVPADRHRSAVVATQNVRENVALSSWRLLKPLSVLTARKEGVGVLKWISRLNIRGASPEGSMNTLSGGNQQKVVLARCLNVRPKVLILDEPTQGVDVGASADIHARIREISRDTTVVVCSSDSLELTSLCTEVLVLQRGKVAGRLVGDNITEANLDHLQLAALPLSRRNESTPPKGTVTT